MLHCSEGSVKSALQSDSRHVSKSSLSCSPNKQEPTASTDTPVRVSAAKTLSGFARCQHSHSWITTGRLGEEPTCARCRGMPAWFSSHLQMKYFPL